MLCNTTPKFPNSRLQMYQTLNIRGLDQNNIRIQITSKSNKLEEPLGKTKKEIKRDELQVKHTLLKIDPETNVKVRRGFTPHRKPMRPMFRRLVYPKYD